PCYVGCCEPCRRRSQHEYSRVCCSCHTCSDLLVAEHSHRFRVGALVVGIHCDGSCADHVEAQPSDHPSGPSYWRFHYTGRHPNERNAVCGFETSSTIRPEDEYWKFHLATNSVRSRIRPGVGGNPCRVLLLGDPSGPRLRNHLALRLKEC